MTRYPARSAYETLHLSIIAVIVAGCPWMVGGCASTASPPALTTTQRGDLASAQCHHVSIGVERYAWSVYSERLTAALRATHLFGRVDALDAFATPPTFVARVERPIYGTAAVPWLTAVTLGLIPTTVEEEHGYSFALTPRFAPIQRIPVEFSYHGPSTLGWRALFVNLAHGGTATDVYRHPSMIENLAWTIVEHEQRICR